MFYHLKFLICTLIFFFFLCVFFYFNPPFVRLQEVKSQPQNMLLDILFDDPWSNTFRYFSITVYLFMNLNFKLVLFAGFPFVSRTVMAKHNYIKIKTVRLQGLLLSVFCLGHHLTHLRDIQTQTTKTGLGGMWVSRYFWFAFV